MNDKLRRRQLAEMSWLAYVLIAVAIGVAAGRIAVVRSKEGDTAFLSANDRSRWCTVASLIEDGTYAIDRQIAITDSTGKRRPWSTIDRVRHPGSDGKMHDYSSKPPLFTTMVAMVYWAVHQATGLTLTDQPIYVTRLVLALVNLPMLLVMLLAIWRSIRESNAPDAVKLYSIAIACFGTALFPLAMTLNNHLPAATSTAIVLMLYLHEAGKTILRKIVLNYFIAGIFAAFTVANELPALAMFVAWCYLFARQEWKATLIGFLPGALVVALAFVCTNYRAHDSFRPPYMHRSDGALIVAIESDSPTAPPKAPVVAEVVISRALNNQTPTEMKLIPTQAPTRWIVESADGNQRYALCQKDTGIVNSSANSLWELRHWDNWYDYPKSYWTSSRSGVDRGEESRLRYFFHITFGYFGIFSLTPVWLILPFGLWLRLVEPQGRYRFLLAAAITAVSLICLAFYVSRPLIDRNYGGVSSSFRWLLWFMPLWVWAMLPGLVPLMAHKWFRPALLFLLALSIFSVSTALDNPWQHPWIYRYASFLGWLPD